MEVDLLLKKNYSQHQINFNKIFHFAFVISIIFIYFKLNYFRNQNYFKQ